MKTLNIVKRISQVLTIAAATAAVVFFFFNFATVVSAGKNILLTGAQMSFKGTIQNAAGETVKMARSSDVWFCFILSALGLVFSALTFKFKGMRYASPVATLTAGIYMLVIACSKPVKFVDVRPLTSVTSITYGFAVWGITIALLAAAVIGIVYLLIDDHIEVSKSKGKLTIPKRIVRFFKDFKSEIKKIVWPGAKAVAKNTSIVLIICLILGAFIWLIDFGLAKLLDYLFSL